MEKIGRERFKNLLRFKMPPEDIDLVMEAYRMSKYAHKGQERDSGERYFEHPKEAALILIEFGVYDRDIIIAELNHDTVEDSFIYGNFEEAMTNFAKRFGVRAAKILRKVTKPPCEPEKKAIYNVIFLENLQTAHVEDKLAKLADRLHNMRNLASCTIEKQKRQLAETETYYLPLAKDVSPFFPQFQEELRKECAATRERIRLHESAARPPQPFQNNDPVRTEEST